MQPVIAQVSLYPLRQDRLSPAINAVQGVFSRHEVGMEPGPMGTLIWGGDEEVFETLREAFQEAARIGSAVMSVSISNACPLPEGAAKDG